MDGISEGTAAAAARQIKGATIAWGRGQTYDFDNPNPEVITVEDVAYALAYTVRWRGQARFAGQRVFYGVGQHCVFGAEELIAAGYGNDVAWEFLWHEDDEVVLPDFPGPGKNCVPGFREFARRQGAALRSHFGLTSEHADLCKQWDMRMMVTEKRDLMAGHEGDWFQSSGRQVISDVEFPAFERQIVPYAHPDLAAVRWLQLYYQLGGA